MDASRAIFNQAAHSRGLPYAVVAVVVVAIYARYLSWNAGWLSGEIDKEIRRMQRRRFRWIIDAAKRTNLSSIHRGCRAGLYRSVGALDRYVRRDAWLRIGAFYFPSFTSIFLACAILLTLFAGPHIRTLLSTEHHLSPSGLSDNLADEESVRKIFEGLIVVAVALIVFVAESIRDTRNTDQKRVLLRVSSLWPLTVVVTLFPLGYLFGKLTGWIAVLIIIVSLWAIYKFGLVIRNLLDADIQEENKKRLLKDRVHDLIMQSVRERIGNNILLRRIGPDREIKLRYTPSRSWIGERQRQYIFIDSSRSGWISDVNFRELRSLTDEIERRLPWGFNQIDEKGPYIAQSRVSYPEWGEGYGRSLAHAENQFGFSTLSEQIAERSGILAAQLIAEINGTLSVRSWTNPVMFSNSGSGCQGSPRSSLPGPLFSPR
jgi:hypothetical protein